MPTHRFKIISNPLFPFYHIRSLQVDLLSIFFCAIKGANIGNWKRVFCRRYPGNNRGTCVLNSPYLPFLIFDIVCPFDTEGFSMSLIVPLLKPRLRWAV
jgi:hypothetical protein